MTHRHFFVTHVGSQLMVLVLHYDLVTQSNIFVYNSPSPAGRNEQLYRADQLRRWERVGGGNAITINVRKLQITSDDAKDTSYCRVYGAKYRAKALVIKLPTCDIFLLCCCI